MAIPTETLEALAASFSGQIVSPGDDDYDQRRKIWNGQITRQPAAIASCSGTADVMAAVRFAREHQIPFSVRGGGHAVAGHALRHDGLVIDLSAMNAVRVDPTNRRGSVQGGALWSDVDRETQAFGLGVTGGIVTHTGVGGLTLGGGIGHLMRKYGLTIDSLRSCDLVTAEGEFLVASEDENPELFWGLRGGGGNFGIVTTFDFDLHPVGPTVLAGMLLWPMSEAREVLGFFRDFTASAPDEVGVLANLRLAPPLPVVPAELHGQPVVALVLNYTGPVEDGQKAFAGLAGLPEPALNTLAAKPYRAHQSMFDATVPHGNHYYWKSWKLPPLTDAMVEVIIEHASTITSPLTSVPIFTQGGAVAHVSDDATAFPNRSAAHDINIVGSWLPDDADPDRHIAWVRGFWSALEAHATGTYINFMSDEDQDAVARAYGTRRYARLVDLKNTYDPDNVFDQNQNIRPAT